jgi:hypothetical protein
MPNKCLTPGIMKSSFQMAAVMNIPPMLFQRICMPNVILKAENII